MRPTFLLLFSFGAALFVTSLTNAQTESAVLDKTTFGKSQNDERDLENSLVPGAQKYGKGEKKALVNASELKSKSIKDATFGGSLLNMGIDPAAPKLDASKEHVAPTKEDSSKPTASTEHASSAPKQSAATEPGSSASKPSESTEADADAARETELHKEESSFSNLTNTATLADNLAQEDQAAVESKTSNPPASSRSSGNVQKKDDQGAAATTTDNSSTIKPDGDR